MGFLKRRSRADPITVFYSAEGCAPVGYTRLLDAPEVGAAVDRITAIIASATIALMENTRKGDKRVRDALSHFIDVTPWEPMSTRSVWMSWIVATLLTVGDGNALCLPHFSVVEGQRLISGLEPMPGASLSRDDKQSYTATWQSRIYHPDEVIHFRLFADLDEPWRGRGYRVRASQVAASLKNTGQLKESLSSPEYKPPFVVTVSSDFDLKDPEAREEFRKSFLENNESGKPWVVPSDLMKVEQLKPLTLAELAIADTIELDKRTVASIFGVPPFLLGLGAYNEQEYNAFIRTVVLPICKSIEQELTSKLLISPNRYFKFNRRHLYAYDMKTLVDIDLAMADRGYVNGDEVREDSFREPAGLTEFKILENYIPYDQSGNQQKLVPNAGTEKEETANEE